jgi:hypothetical protein
MAAVIYATTSCGVFQLNVQRQDTPRKIFGTRHGGLFRPGHKLGFFGITDSSSSQVYVAERVRRSWLTKRQTTMLTQFRSSNQKDITRMRIADCSDVHQVAYYNSHIFLSDTAKNRVLVFDLANRRLVSTLNLGSVRSDRNHINALHANETCLFVGLNNRAHQDSAVMEVQYEDIFDEAQDKNIEAIGSCTKLRGITDTHDLEEVDGRILFSASKNGQVLDFQTGEVLFAGEGWVRGITSDGESIYIGASPKASRKERHMSNLSPTITRISKRDLSVTGEWTLHSGGQLNDLLCVSV